MADPLDTIRQALPAGYILDAPVGSGGQGTVFSGSRNGSRVALKLFGPAELERLHREIDLLSKNTCKFLVGLLDFFTIKFDTQTVPVVVYEFVEGPNLREMISSATQVHRPEVVELGYHVGTAVEHLWAQRIVHRDIKPENIIACTDGRYVLVDVGLAQHLDLATITNIAGQPGTNGYRSPEQCGGRKRLTVHSDVFSLGVTIFEFTTLQHPWQGNQAAMGRTSPTTMGSHRPDIDHRVCAAVHEMMSGVPAKRPVDPGRRFRALGGP